MSYLALAAGLTLILGQTAQAASFTASNQTELVAAMNQANASGDASSTITLTSSFTINGSTLPAVTKSLTIDAGAFTLTSSGPLTLDVAAGGELTVDGGLRATGAAGFSTGGKLIKVGDGVLNLGEGTKHFAWTIENRGGSLLIDNGAKVTLQASSTTPVVSLTSGSAVVTVSGAGTVVTEAASLRLGATNGAILNIQQGATYVSTSVMSLSNEDNTRSTINVSGSGTSLQGGVRSGRGESVINLLNGASIISGAAQVGIIANLNTGVTVSDNGGSATWTVSGTGSHWQNTNYFQIPRGTLSILDGGVVTTGAMQIGFLGINAATLVEGSVLVSGAGSKLITTNGAANTFNVGGGAGNGTKTGTLTIADGGLVQVAAGNGTVNLATTAGSRGTLNIGGAGQAATKAGTLDANTVQFGLGTGVVNFNHTDADYGFAAAIAGAGAVNQIGSGTSVLKGANSYTGATTVNAGTLQAGGLTTLSSASAYTVGGAGTLDLDGFSHGIASLVNGGNVRLGGAANTTLTVAGNYVGNGGTLYVSSVLGDDTSATDLLHVAGDTSGTTRVVVTNVGGAGAQTTGDGIRIVQVDGDSAAGAFALSGPAIGGFHRYGLFQNDLTGTQDDGDWYLRADGLAPTLPTYESYPAVMLGLISLPTLQQRVGDRRPDKAGDAANTALWTRIEGAHARVKADGATVGSAYDSDLFQLQVGFDGEVIENASGALVAGLTAQYSRASADVFSDLGTGSNTTDGYGIGASLTWYGANGVYVDSQAQFVWFDADLSADGVGKLVEGNNGTGYALSIEAGRAFAVKEGWTVTPQAQLSYASADFDDFVDPYGAAVSLSKADSLEGRVGVALGRDGAWQDGAGRAVRSHVYGITSLTYEFLDGATVAVSGLDLVAEPQKFGAEFGVGGSYNWGAEKYALHGEALASTSFDGSYGYKGTVGLTVGF